MGMKNKRMIYIYDENLENYDSLQNKSEWINQKLRELNKEDALEERESDFEDKLKRLSGGWNQ